MRVCDNFRGEGVGSAHVGLINLKFSGSIIDLNRGFGMTKHLELLEGQFDSGLLGELVLI